MASGLAFERIAEAGRREGCDGAAIDCCSVHDALQNGAADAPAVSVKACQNCYLMSRYFV
jgi:hypothetical protein